MNIPKGFINGLNWTEFVQPYFEPYRNGALRIAGHETVYETRFRGQTYVGFSKQEVDKKFGGMIRALSYGAPPHGGMAPGIDRIVMILADKTNIREVTLFPMNQNAQDLLMEAPSEINEQQLKELNIKIKTNK